MKGILEIDFKEINNHKLTKEIIAREPNLIKSTENVLNGVCTSIKKYLKDFNIVVDIAYKIKKE